MALSAAAAVSSMNSSYSQGNNSFASTYSLDKIFKKDGSLVDPYMRPMRVPEPYRNHFKDLRRTFFESESKYVINDGRTRKGGYKRKKSRKYKR